MTEYKYSELTRKIISCAMEVHKFLGNGFMEVIYQRALAVEFGWACIDYAREIEMEIYYKDMPEPIGKRRADFIVENKIIVELKANKGLEDVHKAQILNYLKAYRIEIGLLLNFGTKSLQFNRFILTQ